jgi:hypothetical protein
MTESPSKTPTLDGFLASMPQDQARRVYDDIRVLGGEIVRMAVPTAIDEVLRNIGYSGDIVAMARLLAARAGEAQEDSLRKALTLYGLALDAHSHGYHLAILDPDDEIVQDIDGFDPDSDVDPAPVASSTGDRP